MAGFYSERGGRVFLILMFILVGWLFTAIGWAALASEGKVPEEPGWVLGHLPLIDLGRHLAAEQELHAHAVKRSD